MRSVTYRKKYKKYKKGKSKYKKSNYGNTVRIIKKFLNVEYKLIDVSQTATAISATPSVIQLTNCQQGDAITNREGNQIKITRILIRYTVTINSSATSTFLRCILVLDRQTNGAQYTAGQLLQDVTVGDLVVSPLLLGNKYRFKILYDKVHRLQDVANQIVYKEIFKSVNLPIRYVSNNGDITDLTTNSLSFLICSTETTNTPAVTFYSRVRFIDS